MNIKKVLFITLSSALMCSLCACQNQGSQNNENQNQSQAIDEKIQISYHEPESIKNRGELVVGIKKGGIQFFKDKDGNDAGYEAELAKEIAKEINENVKVKFVENEAEDMLNSLEKGEIDIALASLDASADIKKRFTLSNSYWPWEEEPYSIYVIKSESEKITKLNDFSLSKIAVVKGTYQDSSVKHYLPNAEAIVCENTTECLQKLEKGEVQAIVSDDKNFEKSVANSETVVKSKVTMPEDPNDQGIFAAVMKDNEKLKKVIDSCIEKHKENGDIENWIENAFSALSNVASSQESSSENTKTKEEKTE